jgi:methyl-accepting chemotaxis protein
MSVLTTTRINTLPDDDDEDEIVPTLHPLGPRHVAYGARPERYPVIGAAALDAMAAIAGPPSTPDYERAWNAAFRIVAEAMFAGAADEELAAVA